MKTEKGKKVHRLYMRTNRDEIPERAYADASYNVGVVWYDRKGRRHVSRQLPKSLRQTRDNQRG